MLDTITDYKIRDHDMPQEMRFLLDTYPRESWPDHPGFKEKTRHWMGAHQMFRRAAERVRRDSEALLDNAIAMDDYAARLSHVGGALLGNLHGHHGWEDRVYFPELMRADPRFEAGLELLETDHADLDVVLDDFGRHANRVVNLAHLDAAQAREETANVQGQAAAIEAFLARHLSDEEELAVPIILHHRLRG